MKIARNAFWFTIMLLFFAGLSFFQGCREKADPSLFTLLDSLSTGIGFVNKVEDSRELNILDYLYFYNGGGVAAGDINGDGLTDIYAVSNLGQNRLYLNKGNLRFEDITFGAGVGGTSAWDTGSVMADVNGDGRLDIYVCAVTGLLGFTGHNELFINNGDGTFTEESAGYGLDFEGYSTSAAFLDYDKDGDLDMYLLNQAVHTQDSYGPADIRNQRDEYAGDRLYRNDLSAGGNAFTDVSAEAGIYGSPIGYGLGIGVGDFNLDGWPDMYVSNDFHEDDYFYLNNGDGTFSEQGKQYFSHFSRFSMGNDVVDINHDLYPDVITLDMLPEDEKVLKSSASDDPLNIFLFKFSYGYHYQYSRNALQISQGGYAFADCALMAGIAATDWSWAPLTADYDHDGQEDIFISTGIPRRPNNLDYIKYISSVSIQGSLRNSRLADTAALGKMPDGKVHNYIFKGQGLSFTDMSAAWGMGDPGISNGAAYADLDNDGDLDILTNDLNAPLRVYRNNAEHLAAGNYLRVKLQGDSSNRFGIGSKVILYAGGRKVMKEQYLSRGFQSSVDPVLHFGLGPAAKIDSLLVIWPDDAFQVIRDQDPNRLIQLKKQDASGQFSYSRLQPEKKVWFTREESDFNIRWKHRENTFIDFNRDKLVPYQTSAEGPALAAADVNADGKMDIFLGGAKYQAAALYLQEEGNNFTPHAQAAFEADSVTEITDALFFDADQDGDPDLYAVTAGNEFYGEMEPLKDILYLNDGKGNFAKAEDRLPDMYGNGSCIAPSDFDGDGDTDLFIGGRVVTREFGKTPRSYLLVNDGRGYFFDKTAEIAPQLEHAGMVTAALWTGSSGDSSSLLIAGEWMPLMLFENRNGRLSLSEKLPAISGLWQSLCQADINGDGRPDFIAGNWGINSKWTAASDHPLKMYVSDFDGNGSLEHLVCTFREGNYYPFKGKEAIAAALPMINKRFTSFEAFAGKPAGALFGQGAMKDAMLLQAEELRSMVFLRRPDGSYEAQSLPDEWQLAPVLSLTAGDFNGDGITDAAGAGNFSGVSPYHNRYDAYHGSLLLGNREEEFGAHQGYQTGFFIPEGETRKMQKIVINGQRYLIVARNNAELLFFILN